MYQLARPQQKEKELIQNNSRTTLIDSKLPLIKVSQIHMKEKIISWSFKKILTKFK